uniref:Uncharacterized protein n=1 Tax=viral metagenome TaxID=1070528 RepID=A0A6H1Z9Q6_9ZZZZ
MNWQVWLKGLVSAIVGGAANAIVLMIADPLTFNLQEGLPKLYTVAIVSAIVSAAMYLKQSPLPNGEVK